MKQRVAIDLDDTLAATIEGTLAFVSRRLGKEFEKGDITAIEYWAAYGISDSEAIAQVQAYNLEGFPGLQPLEGAYDTLVSLRNRYSFYIVTAREKSTAQVTSDWVDRHFTGLFEDVIFAGNPFINKEAQPKEVICRELKASLLIDDSVAHVNACAGIGITSILFGGHAWHPRDEDVGRHITKIADWKGVKEYFDAKG